MSPIARRATETARVSELGVTATPGQSALEELVARDDAVALAQQDAEQLEGLRLDRDGLAAAAQLAGLLVELEASEAEDHGGGERTRAAPATAMQVLRA